MSSRVPTDFPPGSLLKAELTKKPTKRKLSFTAKKGQRSAPASNQSVPLLGMWNRPGEGSGPRQAYSRW